MADIGIDDDACTRDTEIDDFSIEIVVETVVMVRSAAIQPTASAAALTNGPFGENLYT